MRVFADTNVVVSAFTTHGLCRDFLRRVLREHRLIFGEPVVTETARILKNKLHASEHVLAAMAGLFARIGTVPAAPDAAWDLRAVTDVDDRPVIACALAAKAELFVTGDKALLVLEKVEHLPIASPRQAWEVLFAAEK